MTTKKLIAYVEVSLHEVVRQLSFARRQSISRTLNEIIEDYLKSLKK